MAYDSYKKLINSVEMKATSEKGDHVYFTVSSRIQRARLAQFRAKLVIYFTLIIGAIASFKPALNFLVNSGSQSGFFEYLSLFAYGGASIIVAWEDLLLSIAASLPLSEIAGLITIVFVFVYSTYHIISVLRNLSLYGENLAPKHMRAKN
ncbi:MAG: hypothetical protein WCV79_03080 [Candidatus Paceibacterota bacterium]|jgi:hypothetical protein